MKEYVNGPINVVRLEGEIEGIKKILFLFMDYHQDLRFQTQCDDIKSVDLRTYLVNNFLKIRDDKKIYDFFLEIKPSDMNYIKKDNLKRKYILNIWKTFSKIFTIKDGVVHNTKEFLNLRLHYIDIRDYLTYNIDNKIYELKYYLDELWKNSYFSEDDLDNLINKLSDISKDLLTVYDIIYVIEYKKTDTVQTVSETYEKYKELTDKEVYDKISSFVNKILTKYDNENIKNVSNGIINGDIKRYFDTLFNLITEYLQYLKKVKNDYTEFGILRDNVEYGMDYTQILYNLIANFNFIYEIYLNLFVRIMDLYFIRRFLDKKYVTNAVVYTGIAHSVSYIHTLVKHFDFKITHHNYMKYNIDKTQEIIKNTDNWKDCEILFFPPKIEQCIEMSDFPQLFH